jgi:N-formylglutamate deformylase
MDIPMPAEAPPAETLPLSATPLSASTVESSAAEASPIPPLFTLHPETQSAPVVFASPHSGRLYPAEFVAASRLQGLSLRRSEDSFVDELFAAAPLHGAPLVSATFPRAFCDPNREPWELDPAMFEDALPAWVNTGSPRVSAGLGTIARVVASGETIYRRKLRFEEAERRVSACWQPYHAELQALIARTRDRFGACLLIDCHSMPMQAGSPPHARTADFVLGDAHGTTCSPRLTRLVERTLTAQGYAVRRNDPYAGGYITRHYGRPRENVHTLQIEVARGLYMDESRIELTGEASALRRNLDRLIRVVTTEALALMAPS